MKMIFEFFLIRSLFVLTLVVLEIDEQVLPMVLNTIVRKASHFLDVYYLLNIRHTIQKVFVFSYYSLLGKVDN